MLLTSHPSLVDQAYEAILGDITDGTLEPCSHLVQEVLAARYGVSRQPIQQALLLLKSDGIVQDAGRRGLTVAPLDLAMMRSRYEVRAALDMLAARLAAACCGASAAAAARMRREGSGIIAAGLTAVQGGDVKAMVTHDIAFHACIYELSGNPVIGPTAQVLWRYLRRVMGDVLRRAEQPARIWEQHRLILEAIADGEAEIAAARTREHIDSAASRLVAIPGTSTEQNARKSSHAAQRKRA